MVSVLIKSIENIVLFAKTHHLKTLYIMTEGVAGNASGPSKSVFMFMDVTGKEKGIDGSFRIKLFWKKPAFWPAILEPVIRKDVQGIGRKLCVPVKTVFAVCDMHPHFFTVNIFIPEMAEFAYA